MKSTELALRGVRLTALTVALCTTCGAHAAQLISNGGFETGLFDWSTANQIGSDGSFVQQTGTSSPSNGDPVPAAPEGSKAAMSDAFGPGSHALYQDFLVPTSLSSAFLSFELFIGNRSDRFATLSTLDFAVADINMQARVDIMTSTADPFSTAVGDVLLTVFQTYLGDPLITGYTPYSIDISALLAAHGGETLRLRFAETDNLGPLQMGVDAVGIETNTGTNVPEPTGLALLGLGLAGLVSRQRRRK